MLIDVRTRHPSTWDESLELVGEGTFGKEPFEEWWARNQARIANLDRAVVEQWVYRHWHHSPFRRLPRTSASARRIASFEPRESLAATSKDPRRLPSRVPFLDGRLRMSWPHLQDVREEVFQSSASLQTGQTDSRPHRWMEQAPAKRSSQHARW